MRHQASAFSSLTVPATRAHAPVRWCRRRTPHGTIIAQTTVTNLFDAGRSIECGMFADTGAGALPMDWKSRLGEFQRCEVVELQLGNGEAVRGQACWPVKLRSRVLARISHQGLRPGLTANEVVLLESESGAEEIEGPLLEGPLLGYVVLEQAQAAVDPVGHRLDPVRHLDLK